MTIDGIVHNGMVVLDQGAVLPEGTRVKVIAQRPAQAEATDGKPSLRERLLKHAGTVADLPADMAEQHDHYIHATPKR